MPSETSCKFAYAENACSFVNRSRKSDTPTSEPESKPNSGPQGSHLHRNDDNYHSATGSGQQAMDSPNSSADSSYGGPTGFPSVGRSQEGSGAAIGQTTTYSSRPLASGDPTGSVVDHDSTDPMTYRRPEARSHVVTAARRPSESIGQVTNKLFEPEAGSHTDSPAANSTCEPTNLTANQEPATTSHTDHPAARGTSDAGVTSSDAVEAPTTAWNSHHQS